MLELILGRAGTGKTTLLRKRLCGKHCAENDLDRPGTIYV